MLGRNLWVQPSRQNHYKGTPYWDVNYAALGYRGEESLGMTNPCCVFSTEPFCFVESPIRSAPLLFRVSMVQSTRGANMCFPIGCTHYSYGIDLSVVRR